MSDISLPARLEAVLYLKGKPLSIGEMADLLNEDQSNVEQAIFALTVSYSQRDTALEIKQIKDKYSLQLITGLGELVQNILPVDITVASLRTLATIAIKKKILQSELVDLRGSGVYDHIKELLEKDFVEKKRQKDGRSFWLTLSENFHRTFSIVPEMNAKVDKKAA